MLLPYLFVSLPLVQITGQARTVLPERTKSSTPSSCSNYVNVLPIAGWMTWRSRDASRNPFRSVTATK